MSTFVVATDEALIARIRAAKRRIVVVAPGLSEAVAEAIAGRYSESSGPTITVILDADPEVCRLGYGNAKALEQLHAAAKASQSTIQHQAGIRICVLMTDDSLLIYSPTPLLVEAGSTSPTKPNAIEVGAELPGAIAKAVGEEGVALPSEAEIGVTPIRDEILERLNRDLADAPPRDFDVARRERVFNSLLEYVEFKVTDYKLTTRVINIPPEVLGLAQNAQEAARWRNGYKVFDGSERMEVELPRTEDDRHVPTKTEKVKYGVKDIDRERREITDKFLLTVPKFDVLIPRAERAKFDERLERFKSRLKLYAETVEKTIQARVEDAKSQLISRVMPKVLKDPPEEFLHRTLGSRDPRELQELVEREVERAFAEATTGYNPRIEVKYKSLTYETIRNPLFRDALARLVPKATVEKMFEEHEAAPSESTRTTVVPRASARRGDR